MKSTSLINMASLVFAMALSTTTLAEDHSAHREAAVSQAQSTSASEDSKAHAGMAGNHMAMMGGMNHQEMMAKMSQMHSKMGGGMGQGCPMHNSK